ncbi:MAG: SDR family oxidoreductase [Candidatus Aenigmarchaeota archaeon]|nr:SDR family oxidoreductase [Candidatus Aenigmarchaeota archaeon]
MDAIYKSLKGKNVIVVGTGGIGGAIVEAYLEQGCTVHGIDINSETLASLSETLSRYEGQFQTHVSDVTKVPEYQETIKKIGDKEQTIDCFVYTAGLGVSSEPDDFKEGLPEELFQLNVFGLMYGIEAASDYLKEGSSITAIGSLNADRPEHGMSMYDATKAAIHQYINTSSLHFGPKGIRVNIVAPGYIETPQTAEELNDPESKERIEKSTTLGRIGKPEDVSSIVVAISSDDFRYVTGKVIPVDGGLADAQYPAIPKQITVDSVINNSHTTPEHITENNIIDDRPAIIIKDALTKTIEECGFGSDYYIKEQIEKVLALADEKGLDFDSSPVIVGFDIQGPVTRLIGTDFYPWTHIKNAILSAEKNKYVEKSIISGWDLSSLRGFRDKRLGGIPISIIGELGAVFEYEGKIYEIDPIENSSEFYNMEKEIFIEAAQQGLKIAIQGNVSKNVNCFYFEGDEPGRGDLRQHFLVKGKDISTTDIYEAIKKSEYDTSDFRHSDEKIIFEPTLENTQALDYILRHVHTLQSVRFSKEKSSEISIAIDRKDNHNFTLDHMKEFANMIIPDSFEIDENADFCVDIIDRSNGFRPTKENAANELGKIRFPGEDYIITNTGDKEGDVFTGKNTIFCPQIGSPAHEYCIKENIPSVPVVNAIDYFLIMAGITNERVECVTPTGPIQTIPI